MPNYKNRPLTVSDFLIWELTMYNGHSVYQNGPLAQRTKSKQNGNMQEEHLNNMY